MNTLPMLSLVVGAAIACAPFSATVSTATQTDDAVAIPVASNPPVVHPHHPMGSKVGGAKGNVTLNWFTVPHNPEEVKKNATPGYTWSRGFGLKTEVALKCGKVTVKAGDYRVAFKLDGEAKNWSIVLSPMAANAAGGRDRQGRGRGGRQGRGRRRGRGGAGIEIPMTPFAGEHAEHMNVVSINYGYKTVGRRDATPASGIKGEFRISFGDIHTAWAFEEVFAEKKDGDTVEAGKKK